MHNHEFGPQPYNPPPPPERHSTFSLVLLIVGVVVAAVIGFGLLFWLLGLVFSLAGFIIKVAIVAAVAAFVWRRVMRRRCGKSRY